MKLIFQALTKYLIGIAATGTLLFLPAGGFHYWQAWLFLAVLFIPMFFMGVVLAVKNPGLLEKRLNSRERQTGQKAVILSGLLIFIAGFVTAALDVRFGWLPLPTAVSAAFAAIFLLGYGLYAEVLRENTYLSRTVEVQTGQKVVDTGLYGLVRHPMYLATVLMFLSIPLILGSLISLALFLIYPVVIVFRIRGEERLLTEQLEGYAEYREKVRYRLIPFIW